MKLRRFDLGWRNVSGDHGLIAAHDGELAVNEIQPMIQWTDITRGSFQEHWFLVSIKSGTMALIRVCPLAGGTRGVASYSHAMIFETMAQPWGVDYSYLVRAFPPLPVQLGQPSVWPAMPQMGARQAFGPGTLTEGMPLLSAVMAETSALTKCRDVPCHPKFTQSQQIQLALQVFSALPRPLQEGGLCFASSAAPGFARPFFGLVPTGIALPASALATFWCNLLGRIDPKTLSSADLRQPRTLFEAIARDAVSTHPGTVGTRVQVLLDGLLSYPMGALEDDKMDATKAVLIGMPPAEKGPLLLALKHRLEMQPVAGAHPLWVLRMMSDAQSLTVLGESDQRKAFLEFFQHMPSELERILGQLPGSALPSLVKAMREFLDMLSAGTHEVPTGLPSLVEDLMQICVIDRVADDCQERHSAVPSALTLLYDLWHEAPRASTELNLLAGRIVNQLVSDPGIFASNLIVISRRLLSPESPDADHKIMGTIMCFLISRSFDPLDGLHGLRNILKALDWLDSATSLTRNDRHGVLSILDAMKFSVPSDDQLWLPALRQCFETT